MNYESDGRSCHVFPKKPILGMPGNKLGDILLPIAAVLQGSENGGKAAGSVQLCKQLSRVISRLFLCPCQNGFFNDCREFPLCIYFHMLM